MATKKEKELEMTAEVTAEVTAEATENNMSDSVTKNETAASAPNELEEVYLFEDNDKYRDDVFVAVNGKRFQIKRGVTVKVPRYVKEVLDNSKKQDKAAKDYMEKKEKSYEIAMKKGDI